MSATVLCTGCGLQVAVPPGHDRPRLRCPECGVMCDVPSALREKAGPVPSPSPQQPAAVSIREERPRRPVPDVAPPPANRQSVPEHPPPPSGQPEPSADAAPATVLPAVKTPEGTIQCRQCGELVRAPKPKKVRSWRCPVCGAPAPEYLAVKAAPRPAPPPSAPPARPPEPARPTSIDPDDDLPLPMGGPVVRYCRSCHKALNDDAVLCVGCGLNQQTGQRPTRTYQRLRRSWEAGLPFGRRLALFFGVQTLGAVLFLSVLYEGGSVTTTLLSWGFFTVLLSFLLGTFDRVELERNERGQARLTRTWHICFVFRRRLVVPLADYEGVVTCKVRRVGLEDWLVVVALLPVGIISAILWWYFIIERDRHAVALARDHGFPELILYCGYREEHMIDLAATLSGATGLPWQRG